MARVLRGGTVDALIACACAAKETGPGVWSVHFCVVM